jgi:hypothetical protein
MIMQRSLAAALAAILVVGSIIPAFARGPGTGRGPRATVGRGHGPFIGEEAPLLRGDPLQGRIPAPLAPPPQAPVINGPLSPSGLPPLGNGIR